MVFNRKRDHAKEHIARGQEDRKRPRILLIIDTRQYMIINDHVIFGVFVFIIIT